MSGKKLWATSQPGICSNRVRHPSKAAAYRSIRFDAELWSRGALRSRYLTVWLDERDGQGWQCYEDIDLAEWAKSEQAVQR